LGLKQTQEDPWKGLLEAHQVGDVITGKVTKLVSFGAFVQIREGIEGLVHISELANHHVEKPEEVVAVGDDVEVKIIEIDSERRRLSLSIKRLHEETEEGDAESEAEATEPAAAAPRQEAAGNGAAAFEAGTEEEEEYIEAPSLGLSDEVFPDETIPAAQPENSGVEPPAEAGTKKAKETKDAQAGKGAQAGEEETEKE